MMRTEGERENPKPGGTRLFRTCVYGEGLERDESHPEGTGRPVDRNGPKTDETAKGISERPGNGSPPEGPGHLSLAPGRGPVREESLR